MYLSKKYFDNNFCCCRDCIQPMYLELWDTLYAFLSSIMDLFEFNPSQVAKIYSNALIPADKKLQDQV